VISEEGSDGEEKLAKTPSIRSEQDPHSVTPPERKMSETVSASQNTSKNNSSKKSKSDKSMLSNLEIKDKFTLKTKRMT
jgi:hypothetical protein